MDPTKPASLLQMFPGRVTTHAVVLADPEGVILDWLAGAERMFGYRRDEILGKQLAILFVPEDLALNIDVWERETAAKSGSSEDDRWQLRKDGGRIWVSGGMNALRDDTGRLVGYAKLMRERTDQKLQVEAAQQRLASLERAQMQRVQFVSTLAHELRNPLGTIGNAVELLDTVNAAQPEVPFATSVIRRQAEFMTRLVGDLLDVAGSAIGKTMQLRKERVVLQDVVTQSLEACRASLERRSHTVQSLMPERPIEIDADRVRLQQVLVNLLDNAAKYTPPRGAIWVKATTEGDDAVVHVRDTGLGIAPDLMPYIFELFTQGPSSGRRGSGLGIGLALVKDTVELHGGSVSASSDGVGKGSQFTVRLPLPGAPKRP